MVDVGSFDISVHALLLKSDQYELLVEAREAMYGDRAAEVSLASVIALLAQEEVARNGDADTDALMDGMAEGEVPYDIDEEYPR